MCPTKLAPLLTSLFFLFYSAEPLSDGGSLLFPTSVFDRCLRSRCAPGASELRWHFFFVLFSVFPFLVGLELLLRDGLINWAAGGASPLSLQA